MKRQRKNLIASLLILVVLAMILYNFFFGGRIEFNGQTYSSIDSAKQAAAVESPAILADDMPFYCGMRLTFLNLVLGFYTPYDPVVCFLTEAESDQLYFANRAFEARYKPIAEKILPLAASAGMVLVAARLFRKRKRKLRLG